MGRWVSRWAPLLLAAVLIAAPRAPSPESAPGEGSEAESPPRASPELPAVAATPTPTPAPAARSAAPRRENLPSERVREILASLRTQATQRARPAVAGTTARASGSGRVELSSRRAVELLDAGGLLQRTSRPLEFGGVSHTRYRFAKQGRPVFNLTGLLRERQGRLLGRRGRLQLPPLAPERARLDADAAVAAALRAAGVPYPSGDVLVS